MLFYPQYLARRYGLKVLEDARGAAQHRHGSQPGSLQVAEFIQ